jgi:D-alanyl-D-alanine dipeptidase
LRAVVAAALALIAQPTAGFAQGAHEGLPAGFVRLREIAPSIRQDIRYAGAFNFTGGIIAGYERAECILWERAAQALKRAQARLAAEGLALKVYDCYRPERAVRAFAAWSRARGGDGMKGVFYPALDKSELFARGYIAPRSRHSRGIAVDVGLVRASEEDASASQAAPAKAGGRCDGPFEERVAESSLDLGTAYDCFSERSATASPAISAQARANREKLRHALAAEGFRNYPREWWHYEYTGSSAPANAYDFPVR